jgi:hypothetical protein
MINQKFIDKDELFELVKRASEKLLIAAIEKDIYSIKSYVDYINNFYEDIKEYDSE